MRAMSPPVIFNLYHLHTSTIYPKLALVAVLELGGFVSQFATHFYRVVNQISKWFAVCESFYEGMDCIIIHLLLMLAT